ncbi:protein-tyrosine phosphatase-like protein [Hygrophoropsis aurantiaca]|uniref:Protein-tyrosine phosphatase-like protein n=1 Tax=Hygrophoropsis aurantiaca TaxID=72124 RepID=A0ACB8AES5_9AGAM|nr:protein-tyrosine phosphatase-like protein [Hygrophoropsis aurantiaca]
MAAHTLPPFVNVDGVINFRDFGGFPTSKSGVTVKSGVLFRSGEITRVTETGKEALRTLGVRKIFDFRTDGEIKDYNTATRLIDGVEIVRAPIIGGDWSDAAALTARLKEFETRELETFVVVYGEILTGAGSAYELVLTHLRDRPGEGCLLHCTAGKDRTGIFACLLLMMLGVSDEDIAKEYALTTIGLEPALPMIAARLAKSQVFRDNQQGVINMGSSKAENMLAAIAMIRTKYGGAEGWIKTATTLKDEDIERIRQNLLVTDA